MNRNKLKTYAPEARRDFIQAMKDRAAFYGLTASKIEPAVVRGDVAVIAGRDYPSAIAGKRRKLEARVERDGFEQTMEAMAYTWFNRLVAIRFMEVNGYLDHGYRVLSHRDGKQTPEILEHAEHVELPGLKKNLAIDLKLEGNKESELYRLLLTAQCNALHKAMPFLFERINDETELLLPDNLLHSDSLVRKLVDGIDEDDWKQVEVIGWLYQFYISEKKAEVIGNVVASADIPAATQLFTPNWIVKYLVQNSLGRKWLATYPNSALRVEMEYYIEPAEQTPEVIEKLRTVTPTSLDPEELTMLDPACGSCHILAEGYDLFKAIYLERGYRLKDIPALILQKNLFGLEIDDRAAQLGAFALMMKARADDRRIFETDAKPNVLAFQESNGIDAAAIVNALNSSAQKQTAPREYLFEEIDELEAPLLTKRALTNNEQASMTDIASLLNVFREAKTFGSLIRTPKGFADRLDAIVKALGGNARLDDDIFAFSSAGILRPLVSQASLLCRQYDFVVTNPPYMGVHGTNMALKQFGDDQYPLSKSNLYSMFIVRCTELTARNGITSMIAMQSWMFLSSFRQLRDYVTACGAVESLIHLGSRAFSEISGEVVQTAAFCVLNFPIKLYKPTFFDLQEGETADKQRALVSRKNRYANVTIEDLGQIPGSPLSYWVSQATLAAYKHYPPLSKKTPAKVGISTGRNHEYILFWHEVAFDLIGIGCTDRNNEFRYFPHNKAGGATRWYGEQRYVLKYSNADIARMEKLAGFRHDNADCYFRESISWSKISPSGFVARYYPVGFTFNSAAVCIYPETPLRYLGFLNSNVFSYLVGVVCNTLNFTLGDVVKVPTLETLPDVDAIVKELVTLYRRDLNNQESSWEFEENALLKQRQNCRTIAESWHRVCVENEESSRRAAVLETENNRLFIDAYELGEELKPGSSDDQVSLRVPNQYEDVKQLLSYAIGCILGRYSLDKPGLIYAKGGNKDFDPAQYKCVPSTADGITVLNGVDDAVDRVVEFIATAWPESHLEDNIAFVAGALGRSNGDSSRETVRKYLASGFYGDHLSTYKKRPIYWLFSSGKLRAFQCLVYLHRYNQGTLARVRTAYVIPLQGRIASQIEQLENDKLGATATSHRKKFQKALDDLKKQQGELLVFEEKLKHFADQQISLNLNEGVKFNYGKFGDLLAEVKSITGGKDDE